MITDTHWGIRDGDERFEKNMDLFLDNVFFPYLKENQIRQIIHLGDLVHNRKKIGFTTLNHLRNNFLEPLNRMCIKVEMILGNHDMPFKDVYEANACTELLSKYDNFTIVDTVKDRPEWDMILIPWLTKNNREEYLEKIAKSNRRFAAGHLELSGFNFSKIQVATHGDNPEGFKKFDAVFSGHYHYRHSKGNIHYLGSPTEQTWIDVDTSRGFHVLDTESGEVEFIENPYNYFEYVDFGSNSYLEEDHPRHFRLNITGDEPQSEVDKFINKLYEHGAFKVDVVAKRKALKRDVSESEDLSLEEIEDTPTFINNFVDSKPVANLMINLYNRAINEMSEV